MGSVSLVNGHVDDDMPRYTEQEIIESLEEMSAEHPGNFSCDVLDLINRQKAEIESNKAKIKISAECIARQDKEIERLQKENNQLADIGKMYSEIKAEAVKEIIERLEAEITISDKHVRRYNDSKDRTYNNSLREALKIIKEMVGKD